ncbi:MAG: class I SAM-dependent methyltransferase [Planctomycetes bacterium]|jgi:hypothetical protein|nr:class I SAM-dependent methyltransferase [Planctomycetota bacterium]
MMKEIADRISLYNRQRKWRKFLVIAQPDHRLKILDVGFSEQEYSPGDNFLEKNYPYPENITALGIDRADDFKKRYPRVTTVEYRGGLLPFPDRAFGLNWSNAVLEHVGSREEQVLFLRELKRVGNKTFLTTPNRHFPFEVHTHIPFLHWLPKRWFDFFLVQLGKSWASGLYMNLLTLRQIKKLLHNAGIEEYCILRNRLLFCTLDYIVLF